MMDQDSVESSEPPVSFAAAAVTQKVFFVDVREHFNFYEQPTFPVLSAAVHLSFPDDAKVIILKLTGKLAGVYKILALGAPRLNSIKLDRKNKDTGSLDCIEVPIKTSGPGHRSREDDLLITIVEGDVGRASVIPGTDFDALMSAYGEVVIPTKAQKYKDTITYNGNRFVVLCRRGKEDVKIPDRLKLHGQSFLLKYKGKEWLCGSCMKLHKGPCPYLKEFYAAKEAKRLSTIKTQIVGDSCLRHVESVGLRADVACMTGACAGQLVPAIEDNPNFSNMSHIIIAAGNNDTMVKNDCDEEEMVKRVDKSLGKISAFAKDNEHVDFSLVDTIPPDNDAITICEKTVRTYFKKKVEKICTELENVHRVTLGEYPEKWVRRHPTEASTRFIIEELIRMDSSLLINKDFITTDKIYRGVDNPWLSGCTGCGSRGLFTSGGFCSSCLLNLNSSEIEDVALYKFAKESTSLEFPQGQKRARGDLTSSDDNSHDDAKLVKI